jgi:hypothetical protein
MKRSISTIYLMTILLLGITNYTFSQSLIGTWNKISGPGDPPNYTFLDDSTVIIHSQTRIDTADYSTFSIPSSDIRGIDLGRNGVVGWRGIYTVSEVTFSIEGYWYTGLPLVSTPKAFTSATLYQRATVGIIKTKAENLQSFALLQNNLNHILLKLSIPERDFIRLDVYDSKGRKIRTLINNFYNAGAYRLFFDVKEFNNGVYFFQFIIGSHSFTKQVNLIK